MLAHIKKLLKSVYTSLSLAAAASRQREEEKNFDVIHVILQ